MSARSNSAGRPDPAKRSLKDRASEVEASAARIIKGRGRVQVSDQPSPASMNQGSAADNVSDTFKASEQASHDAGGGDPGRSKAARGQAPRQEGAMGRHESFDPTTSVRTSYAPAGAAHSDALSPSGVSVGIRALRDCWRAAHTAAHAPGLSESELHRLGDLATAAEKVLIAAPIRTASDLVCKVEALREHIGINDLGFGSPNEVVLAVCRGVELLAHMPAAVAQRTDAIGVAPTADPILQAIDDHRAAFDAANSTDELTDEAAEEAFWRWQRIYKALQAVTPTTPQGVCALAAHLRQFLKDGQNEIGTTFQEEALSTLLNAIDRFSAAGVSASATPPEAHDFSSIDSEALAHLCDVFEAIETRWDAVSCQPVIEGTRNDYSSATSLAHAESKQAERARRRVMDEIRRRQPRDDGERDTLLSVRIRDELLREGHIMDRDLLLEAVKAWG